MFTKPNLVDLQIIRTKFQSAREPLLLAEDFLPLYFCQILKEIALYFRQKGHKNKANLTCGGYEVQRNNSCTK